jgi:hypothetical protein
MDRQGGRYEALTVVDVLHATPTPGPTLMFEPFATPTPFPPEESTPQPRTPAPSGGVLPSR